jgi:hypothetical protein
LTPVVGVDISGKTEGDGMADETKVKIEAEKLKKAEEFADFMESEMRGIGSTGDYFCSEQRVRWRQHAIRAFLGASPGLTEEQTQSERDVIRPKAKR